MSRTKMVREREERQLQDRTKAASYVSYIQAGATQHFPPQDRVSDRAGGGQVNRPQRGLGPAPGTLPASHRPECHPGKERCTYIRMSFTSFPVHVFPLNYGLGIGSHLCQCAEVFYLFYLIPSHLTNCTYPILSNPKP